MTTTTPTTQVRMPTGSFRRWLHRAGIWLPAPLDTTYAARDELPLDVITQITAPRITGSATPAQLEGLDARTEQALGELVLALDGARIISYALRAQGGEVLTVAAVIGGTSAVLVVDRPGEIALRSVPAVSAAESVVRALPPLRPASLRPVEVPVAALAAVSAPGGADRARRADIARRAGVDAAVLDEIHRVSTTQRAIGIVGSCRPGDMAHGTSADWFESRHGALLKSAGRPGHVRFAPADRAALTRLLVGSARDAA